MIQQNCDGYERNARHSGDRTLGVGGIVVSGARVSLVVGDDVDFALRVREAKTTSRDDGDRIDVVVDVLEVRDLLRMET